MKELSKQQQFILGFILILSIIIVLKVFIQDRSFFLDEANLARNIIELDYTGFLSPLRYEQFAPPLYMMIQKILIEVFGNYTHVLRVLSLFSFIGGLMIIYKSFSKRFSFPVQLFLIVCIGLSPILMRYGTECKQYAIDFFFACLTIWIIFIIDKSTKTSWLTLTILGVIGVWFSMPFAFCLGGLGLYCLFINRAKKKHLAKAFIMSTLWLISFGVLYFVSLKNGISSGYLSEYHLPYFFGRNGNAVEQIASIYRMLLGKTLIPIVFGIMLTLFGLYYLFKNNVGILIGLVIPILSMIIASSIGYYSILERLMVFSIPYMLVLMAYGLTYIFEVGVNSSAICYTTYLLMGLVIGNFLIVESSLKYLVKHYHIEQGKEVLDWVSKETKTPVYLSLNAIPSYELYCNLLDNKIQLDRKVIFAKSNLTIQESKLQIHEESGTEFILVDVHTFGKEKETFNQLKTIAGKLKKCHTLLNAEACLISKQVD